MAQQRLHRSKRSTRLQLRLHKRMGRSGLPTKPHPFSHTRDNPTHDPPTLHQQQSIHLLSRGMGSNHNPGASQTTPHTSIHTTLRQRPSHTRHQQRIRKTPTAQQPYWLTLGMAQQTTTHTGPQESSQQGQHCRPFQQTRFHHRRRSGLEDTTCTNRTFATSNEQDRREPRLRTQTRLQRHSSYYRISQTNQMTEDTTIP